MPSLRWGNERGAFNCQSRPGSGGLAGGFDLALNPSEFDLVLARAADAKFVGNEFADHAVSFGKQIDVAGLILAES